MPTPIIPVAIPQFTPSSGQVTGPADGDPLVAASVNNAFAPLADRSKVCFDGLRGVRSSFQQFVCDDGANWYCSGFAAGRGTSRAYDLSQTNGSIAGLGLGALAANDIYYIYARETAGVWNFIGSTTGPDPWRRYMIGDEQNLFLTWFATDSGASPIAWSQWDTYYSFKQSQLFISAGIAAVYTAAPISFIPPWVELITASVRIVNTDTVNYKVVEFSKDGTNTDRQLVCAAAPVGSTSFANAEMSIPVAQSGAGPFYRTTTGGSTVTALVTGCYL